MTNGLRNHPGNRKGMLRDYLIGALVVTVIAFGLAALGEYLWKFF